MNGWLNQTPSSTLPLPSLRTTLSSSLPAARRPALDLDDLAATVCSVPACRSAMRAAVAEVVVGAREVEQQIADGLDAELLQQLGATGRRP